MVSNSRKPWTAKDDDELRIRIERNEPQFKRILSFIDAWNSRQPEVFDALVAPDVVRHCEATPDLQARNRPDQAISAAGHGGIS